MEVPEWSEIARIAPTAFISVSIAAVTVWGVLRVQKFTADLLERRKKDDEAG